LLHPAADHGVHHVSGHLLTCTVLETAQSDSCPCAAAFAVVPTQRPSVSACSAWTSPKGPVEVLREHSVRTEPPFSEDCGCSPVDIWLRPEGHHPMLLLPAARKLPASTFYGWCLPTRKLSFTDAAFVACLPSPVVHPPSEVFPSTPANSWSLLSSKTMRPPSCCAFSSLHPGFPSTLHAVSEDIASTVVFFPESPTSRP
jgi:hypothetical protein